MVGALIGAIKMPKLFAIIWGGMFGGIPWSFMVLPALTQNAIYLADIEQLSYREIGHILKKTDSSVKVLIHRARKALEKIIVEEAYKYEN